MRQPIDLRTFARLTLLCTHAMTLAQSFYRVAIRLCAAERGAQNPHEQQPCRARIAHAHPRKSTPKFAR